MSTSNDRYSGTSYNKSRRSSPDHSQGFFPTQGGRTVLPPILPAFPTSRFPVYPNSNQYTPRSSPARYEVNPQVLYHYSPEPATSYPLYDTHDRLASPTQNYNYTTRTSLPVTQPETRKLPQLATNTSAGWSTTPYSMPPASNYQASSGIRSPTACYGYQYPSTNQGGNYTYLPEDHGHIEIPSMNTAPYINPYEEADLARSDHHHRSSSPYGRSSAHIVPTSSTPPPVSPTSPEESTTIKKKRKRADARQLKVLNDTYNRTAFPSTEERAELAKKLDMTARSVQIWFQNKRQSMRQTNRQSSTMGSSSSQPFSMSGPDLLDELEPTMGYTNTTTAAEAQYPSRHSPDMSRSSHTSSSQRRVRLTEEPEHRGKWF